MSNLPPPSASRSNLDAIFNAALRAYKTKTGNNITSHPLATELQSCDSPDAILAVLQRQMPSLDQPQTDNETFAKCLIPTVHVLYTLSETLGEGVGLVITAVLSLLRTRVLMCFSRCSHQQKQFLLASVFSSWSAAFYLHCAAHFDL
jgi:hypothetical protein